MVVNGGAFNFSLGAIAMHKTHEDEQFEDRTKMCIVQQIKQPEGPMAGIKMYRVSYMYKGAMHEGILPEVALVPWREPH